MDSSRFHTGIALRIAALFATMLALAWIVTNTPRYATAGLLVAAALAQTVMLVRFAAKSGREVAEFLDAIAAGDTSQSSSTSRDDSEGLGSAMARVLEGIRTARSECEKQAHYLQALIAHVPVALISADASGGIQLLNRAARRLFETALTNTEQFTRYGMAFSQGMESLRAGNSAIVRMERVSGGLQLKAAVTELTVGGVSRRLISLQNIENEMSAQEMTAWQTVIRVMAHEVMNSLTPVSSLSATARDLVNDVLNELKTDDPHSTALAEARDALETVARRSEGLLHFVQNHRRLTKRLMTRIEITPLVNIFARQHRLFSNDLIVRHIQMTTRIEPETLEVTADPDLLEQALINLIRNAIEALREVADGRICLSGRRDPDGRIAIAVADNGPGIPEELRDKIFVPFYTTKRQGSGVGLTVVRQIAAAHGAIIDVSHTPLRGATVSLRF